MKHSVVSDSNTKIIGSLGEDLASRWLIDNGYKVLERNYWKKWGEIDIVAIRLESVHFVEVKSVSYETRHDLLDSVTRGTYRPEEQVHRDKLRKLANTIETWIVDHSFTGNFQIDVVTVRMVSREKFAVVDMIENVIIE